MRTTLTVFYCCLIALAPGASHNALANDGAGVRAGRRDLAPDIRSYPYEGKGRCGLDGLIEVCRIFSLNCAVESDWRFSAKGSCDKSAPTLGEYLDLVNRESPQCKIKLDKKFLAVKCFRTRTILDKRIRIRHDGSLADDIVEDVRVKIKAREPARELPPGIVGESLVRAMRSPVLIRLNGEMSAREALNQAVEADGGAWVFTLDRVGRGGVLSLRNK